MKKDVFINCPFDESYNSIFDAILFTTNYCGFKPRCALEKEDSSESRKDKIFKIIEECNFGIHDISRTELNEDKLPRFNMPFEFGVFIGAKQFGSGRQKRKKCIVLDSERYRFQKFLSDISGQDIRSHDNNPDKAIENVRNWLNSLNVNPSISGATTIKNKYSEYKNLLPKLLEKKNLTIDDVQYADTIPIMSEWISQNQI
jgi:hypothetical protein